MNNNDPLISFLTYFKSEHRDKCTYLTHRVTIALNNHAANLSSELIFIAHFVTHIRTETHTIAIILPRSSLAIAVKISTVGFRSLTFARRQHRS
jgi:hypothetical protein